MRTEPVVTERPVTEPTILHADLDSFYASVEQRDDPGLRGRPVAVGGGVLLAASYEARAYGVRTAMGERQARRLCPQLIVVRPRMSAYLAASRAVFEVFADISPIVEPMSVDEAFLEVAGLRRIAGPAADIASMLRSEVRRRTDLPITVGVARTKFLAKVASGVAKPDGLLVVPVDGELAFLHPLPVERLWGVGRVTAQKLRSYGIRTVAEVAEIDEPSLVAILGSAAGRHLHALAHNRDARRVTTGVRRRSIGAQSALGRRTLSAPELDARLMLLVDRVGRRLRAADRLCRTVVLRLRFADFTKVSRSYTLRSASCDTSVLLAALRTLLSSNADLIRRRGLTLIGVTLLNLTTACAHQLELPFLRSEPGDLDAMLDSVRARFGNSAISPAALVRPPGRPGTAGSDVGWSGALPGTALGLRVASVVD